MSLTMNEYQRKAWETAVYPDIGFNLYYPALGLGGEAGEVQNKVKKVMRDDDGILSFDRRDELIEELGDLLWYIAALASEMEVELNEIAEVNIDKLESRKERGKLKGSGDER